MPNTPVSGQPSIQLQPQVLGLLSYPTQQLRDSFHHETPPDGNHRSSVNLYRFDPEGKPRQCHSEYLPKGLATRAEEKLLTPSSLVVSTTMCKFQCKALVGWLIELGYKSVSGGSDNHLILVDLGPLGIDGSRVEKILDIASITFNKNSVPGDKSAFSA